MHGVHNQVAGKTAQVSSAERLSAKNSSGKISMHYARIAAASISSDFPRFPDFPLESAREVFTDRHKRLSDRELREAVGQGRAPQEIGKGKCRAVWRAELGLNAKSL